MEDGGGSKLSGVGLLRVTFRGFCAYSPIKKEEDVISTPSVKPRTVEPHHVSLLPSRILQSAPYPYPPRVICPCKSEIIIALKLRHD